MDKGKSMREFGEIFLISVGHRFSWAMSGDVCDCHMARSWHRLGGATEPSVGLPTAALFPQCVGRAPPPNDPVLKASNAKGETLISDHDPRR